MVLIFPSEKRNNEPKKNKMKRKIVKQFHVLPPACHFGYFPTSVRGKGVKVGGRA